MAETMSDKELRDELLAFGETNIGPITNTTRSLYTKKLNHYRARAKVPGKKGASAVVSKKLLGFSSDESGDEAGPSRPATRRRGRPAKTAAKPTPEPRTPIPTYDDVPKHRTPTSGLRRRPLRPLSRSTEPEDDDSQNGSMAASPPVDARSFNMQTSLNTTFTVDDTVDSSVMPSHETFDSSDSDFDPLSPSKEDSTSSDFMFPRTSTQVENNNKPHGRPPPPGRRVFPAATTSHGMSSPYPPRASDRLTTVPLLTPTPARPSNHSNRRKQPQETSTAQYISMFIVIVGILFFLSLGFTYLSMRSAAPEQDTGSANLMLCETVEGETAVSSDDTVCFTKDEVRAAKPLIRHMSDLLHTQAGEHECGGGKVDKPTMLYSDLKQAVSNAVTVETIEERRAFDVALKLIVNNPDWKIKLYDSVETLITPDDVSKGELSVSSMESTEPYLSFLCRVSKSLSEVFIAFLVLVVGALLVVLIIAGLRWRWRKQEEETAQIYELVEKIIDILKNHSVMVAQQNHGEGGGDVAPYLAIPHVRDMLIPPQDRRRRQALWDKACKFLSANESRVRVETQKIQGEEFAVWRWIQQSHANGSKVWQGQACGEKESSMILPVAKKYHTSCLKVRNMFDIDIEYGDDWHIPIQDAILEKCGSNHRIVHIAVDKTSREGCVFLKCSTPEAAADAYRALDAWWFDGKLVTVKLLRLERYHERFPDAVHYTSAPLTPSNDRQRSLSQPFHRSIIESS